MLRTCAKELNPTWICCFINVCRLPIFIVDSLTVKPNKNRLFQYFLFTTFQQKCQETRSHTRYPFLNTLQCSGTCSSKIPQLLRPISGATMGPLQMSDHKVQKSPNWRANDALGAVQTGKKNSNLVALFTMSQCIICSPVTRFCITRLVSCKGLIPFTSLQCQGSKPSNFTILLVFLTFKI